MHDSSFANREFYHVYNRGVEKRNIFLDDKDKWRFLTLLLILQGRAFIPQMGRLIPIVKHSMLDNKVKLEDNEYFKDTLTTRMVELVCFCMMPNHFHLILQQLQDGGISSFMQRLGDSYTKYFNIRYERTGHLFGGTFQSRHIDQNEYLTYLSAYIHMNPRELKAWRKKEIQYPWSSFQDYEKRNRLGLFLNAFIVIDQFQQDDYKNFVTKINIRSTVEDAYLIDP